MTDTNYMKALYSFLMWATAVVAIAQPTTPGADAQYIKDNYTKYEYSVPVRDGVKLFTSVYVPKDASETKKYPILMQRTPYSVAPYGADKYKTSLGPSSQLMRDGYIFVYQDGRGRWMSEGVFNEMTPHVADKKSNKDVDEASDTYDTIEWLLKNLPNHNGKVGQYGISYPGFYTSAGTICGHPALVASSPQAPMADLWRDDSYHNGAFMLPHNFNFYPYFTNRTDDKPTQAFAKPYNHGTPDGYKYFLELGPLSNSQDKVFKGKDPYWTNNLDHPAYDDFWKARNILTHLKGIKHAVMVVGGWYDAEDLYGTMKTYQTIEKNNPGIYNVFVVGPWVHGGWARGDGKTLGNVNFASETGPYYRENIERKFFNYFLKGEGDANFPEAQLFETGTNQWRSFDVWPPKNATEKKLYLLPKGKLSFDAPTQNKSFDEYPSDPNKPVPFIDYVSIGMPREYMVDDQRFAARRPDVLVYQTDVLDKDVTLAGNIWANLKVSVTGTDADFIVKVIDVYPDNAPQNPNTQPHVKMAGYQQMVRSDAFRGRYRKDITKPSAFTPNKVEDINLELQDVLHTFQKGHRIMVQVQSTWFPVVDRNPQQFVPNINYAKPEDFKKATHRIHTGANEGSSLTIRVLE